MTSGTADCVLAASQPGNANFNAAPNVVRTVAAAKATPTVTITWNDSTYTGSPNTATATVTGVGGASIASPAPTFEYFTGSTAGAVGTGTPTAPSNAGTYTVRASFAGNADYVSASATKTITISKANQTITFAQPTTPRTFGDTFTVNPTASSGLAVILVAAGGCTATSNAPAAGWTIEMTSGRLTRPRASQPGNANFNAAPNVVRTVAAAKATPTVTITWNDSTYTGSPNTATATVTGVGGASIASPAPTFEYFTGSTAGAVGTGTPTAPSNAGTYTVRASFAGNADYVSASATKTITISKANRDDHVRPAHDAPHLRGYVHRQPDRELGSRRHPRRRRRLHGDLERAGRRLDDRDDQRHG